MNNRLPILLLMISSFFIQGQHINFQENVNYEASELVQSLNKEGDSLLLESDYKQIRQVNIFNDNYSESIDVYDTKTKIDLKVLPVGNFIIQANIDRKLIIMYLEKNEVEKQVTKESPLYYWVISESNSSFGSSKTMRLESKEDIAKLISKNQLELRSEVGKNNKLLVYEIYNKTKFMKRQFRNHEFYKMAKKSNTFNVIPFYDSENEIKEELVQ